MIIVTGAPRTGTHFLHALLCTSRLTNAFIAEAHYLYHLLEAYIQTIRAETPEIYGNFSSRADLDRHHFDLMRVTIRHSWEALGKPDVLVIKQCGFTPVIPIVAKHFDNCSFVCIIRDARDAIASELRAEGAGDDAGLRAKIIENAISRYNTYYGAVVAFARSMGERLHLARYEDLAAGRGFSQLSAFTGLPDLAPERLWEDSSVDLSRMRTGGMGSELWGRPVSAAHIGRYRDTLTDEIADRIFCETRRVMLRFEALIADCGNGTQAPAIRQPAWC